MTPSFEYIPVLGGGPTSLVISRLLGLSTRHDDANSDHGRLYASIAETGGALRVSLYADYAGDQLIAQGGAADVGLPITLAAQNSSGISGAGVVTAYTADAAGLVVLPTFATDVDVLLSPESCASLPGYDAGYGLAYLHARAMRELMAIALPRAVPHLYAAAGEVEASGLSAFVPPATGALPDLTRMANVDLLRSAQAALVKAFAGEQLEHLTEMAALAKAARARFIEIMEELAAANLREKAAAAVEKADDFGVSFGRWSRG